jgi:hypothetical protein
MQSDTIICNTAGLPVLHVIWGGGGVIAELVYLDISLPTLLIYHSINLIVVCQ